MALGFLYITRSSVKVAPHPASPPPGATRNQDQSSLQLLTCHCLWGLFPERRALPCREHWEGVRNTSQAARVRLPNLCSSLLGSGNVRPSLGYGGSSAPWRCGRYPSPSAELAGMETRGLHMASTHLRASFRLTSDGGRAGTHCQLVLCLLSRLP